MNIKDLYEQKRLVAINLKDCIRDRGYTKISIANKLGMDKSELETILDGVVIDQELFESAIIQILGFLNMSADDLLFYCSKSKKKLTYTRYDDMSDTAKRQYYLLMDVIDLCSIYYEPNKVVVLN